MRSELFVFFPLLVMLNETEDHDFPAEPDDPVISKRRSLQLSIIEGIDNTTEGTTGLAGGNTSTV